MHFLPRLELLKQNLLNIVLSRNGHYVNISVVIKNSSTKREDNECFGLKKGGNKARFWLPIGSQKSKSTVQHYLY